MNRFNIDCHINTGGSHDQYVRVPVALNETIDSLMERATNLYGRLTNFKGQLRPLPDTPYILDANGARYPQQGSILNNLPNNTCDGLWQHLRGLNDGIWCYSPHLYIDLGLY